MDLVLLVKAAILGVVEGLTEFLPVSSTGHLILAASLLDFHDARGKLFEIVIQSGAILAVVWEFRARIGSVFANATSDATAQRLLLNIGIAFLPLALLGLLFGKALKANLFNAPTVAAAFILGGFVILWAERRNHVVRVTSVDDMSPLDALKVGVAQAFALIPGTSRSGATIIGGMLFGLSRQVATEFTFYRRSRRSVSRLCTRSTRSASCWHSTSSACGSSGWSRRSCRRSRACAGCCATSRRTPSCRSRGTGSRSDCWCCSPPGPA